MNVEAPARRAVPWSLGDILLVMALAVILIVAAIAAFGLAVGLVIPDPQAWLQRQVVIASAIIGMLVYGAILLAVYLLVIRRRHVPWRVLGFRRLSWVALVLAPVIAFVQLMAAAIANALVVAFLGDFDNPQLQAITGGQGFSWTNYLLMLVLVGGVAPIVEEILFRGLLYNWLRTRLPLVLAVVLSAALFSIAHVIPLLFPALLVAGLILTLAYEWSGSLWLPILLHAMQNSLAVTVIFAALAGGVPLGR